MTRTDFEQILERYQRPVISIIYKMTFNWEVARDLAQDAFVDLWRSRGTIDSRRPVFTLLYRIAVNKAIDYGRKIKTFPLSDGLAAEGDFSETMEARELRATLKQCAERLPPRQRAIFVLRDMEGLSIDEVAEVLGQSAGAVRSNLHLARQAVRNHLVAYHKEVVYEYGL